MSVATVPSTPSAEPAGSTSGTWRRRGRRSGGPAAAVIARGEPTLWLTAGALAVALFMITGLIALVVITGGETFWPKRLVHVELRDGRMVLGEVAGEETFELNRASLDGLSDAVRPAATELLAGRSSVEAGRTLFRVDNKQLTGEPYVWIDGFERKPGGTSLPEWAVAVERTSWGRFLGTPEAFIARVPRPVSGAEEQLTRLIEFFELNAGSITDAERSIYDEGLAKLRAELATVRERGTAKVLDDFRRESAGGRVVAVLETGEEQSLSDVTAAQPVATIVRTWSGSAEAWKRFERMHPVVRENARRLHHLDRHGLGSANERLEASRMAVVRAGMTAGQPLAATANRLVELDASLESLTAVENSRGQLADAVVRRFGTESPLADIARRIVGELDAGSAGESQSVSEQIDAAEADVPVVGQAAVEHYRARARETRRLTTEIGADMDRLRAVNDRYVWKLTTADGTPQEIPVAEIVRAFPANRLGFVGRLGVYFSRWSEFLTAEPREANTEGGVFPAIWGTVAMTLIMTIAVVPFGVLAALFLREYAKAGPVISAVRIAVNNLAGVPSIVFGVFGLGFFCYFVGAGIDQLLYPAYVYENKPVFGTGGLMWASLTLALLTLPVVIVATEEALSAVPNSMREGSYGCGASKWQTIWRIVLPRALPGIMTGMILAMARGAGEVAPLMLVGAVKIAPELPVDTTAPFLHPSRSFMHLGFHVYDLGFQSPDSEAARPMVFTTTLLLISIVALLNVTAIWLRNRLRRRFSSAQF